MNILILGGDDRYIHVIRKLTSKKFNVYLAGYDEINFDNPNIFNKKLTDIKFNMMDAILLPVSGTGQDGNIECTYSNTRLHLSSEHLQQTPSHCIVFTGIANDYLKSIANTANREIIPLFARNDIAIYNSIPTAEATLKIAIEETDVTIHGSNVLVLGFGRVGITVARSFHALGANVTVSARKAEHFARINEMGLKSIKTNQIETIIKNMDIIINTIPYTVLPAKLIEQMNVDTLIIDLASKPGGTNFIHAKKRGINAIHALGLPGKTAPRTAGEIIGNVLLELLEHKNV